MKRSILGLLAIGALTTTWTWAQIPPIQDDRPPPQPGDTRPTPIPPFPGLERQDPIQPFPDEPKPMPPDKWDRDIGKPERGVDNAILSDADVIKALASGGMAEVDAGKLAVQKASSGAVRTFAKQMVDDHSKTNEKLKALAKEQSVALPIEADAGKQAAKSKLEKMSGPAFDSEYMKGQVANHERTVQLLQHQISSGRDAKVKAFAQEILPTVQHHLQMARDIQQTTSDANARTSGIR